MDEQELKTRTKQFGLRVMKLVGALGRGRVGDAVARQLVWAGTSVGANYRAACRGRSQAEFRSKIGIAEEEADEAAFWMELIIEGDLLPKKRVAPLLQEADELTAIFAASIKTSRRNPESKIRNPKPKMVGG